MLAPSCRFDLAPWCEASDTSLVGGPCFRKLTAEARAGRIAEGATRCMNSSVESQKFFGFSGSFGLQGADRSMRFSCNCKGAPRRSRMLDARSSLRYGSCPWVWSSRAVSLCPSCIFLPLTKRSLSGQDPLADLDVHTHPSTSVMVGTGRPVQTPRESKRVLSAQWMLMPCWTVHSWYAKVAHDTADMFFSSSSFPVNDRQFPVG